MNGFTWAQTAFLWSAAILVVASTVNLARRPSSSWWPDVYGLLVFLFLGASLFLWVLLGLSGLVAAAGQNPYTRTIFLALFRGQYAWIYWGYLVSLLAAQLLWIPAVRERAWAALLIALLGVLAILAHPIALAVWSSR